MFRYRTEMGTFASPRGESEANVSGNLPGHRLHADSTPERHLGDPHVAASAGRLTWRNAPGLVLRCGIMNTPRENSG